VVFSPKIKYCIDREDNEDCIDELDEYRDDGDLLDARTLEKTELIGYPVAVVQDRAYIAVNPTNLRELTFC
jgi:hypothetical protein